MNARVGRGRRQRLNARTRRPARALGWFAVAALVAGLLSACAGVPRSSSPQIIQSVAVHPPEPQAVAPQNGADPRAIVAGFLTNNASSDNRHSAARAFLTPEEQNRWSDSTQTTIVDRTTIGNFTDGSLTVTGRTIGTLDQTGAFTPSLENAPFPLTIGLKQVSGQWRIDSLPNGLLIDSAQFSQYYQKQLVYFYDQSEQHLVPTLHYTTLVDPTQLGTWLMTQLVSQPSAALSTSLPSIPNASQVKVSVGATLRVEVPGASQLDSATRNRMAAQVALTLNQASPGIEMTITDGGRPVTVPLMGSTEFTAAEFVSELDATTHPPQLYYISKGGIKTADGKPLPGGVGSGQYGLNAAALTNALANTQVLIAGTTDQGASSKLLIGSSDGPLRRSQVSGALSRPAWAPDKNEVWIGDGATLYRVDLNGHKSPVQLTAGSGTVSGRILAVRFSPEGARIALVIKGEGGASQIWIGWVLRSPKSVRVSGLNAISPLNVKITDVAWNDAHNLFAIGENKTSGDANVYEVECDGSQWTARGIGNLPQKPDSITLAPDAYAAVSAGPTVWVQPSGTWKSPSGDPAYGTNPIYLE